MRSNVCSVRVTGVVIVFVVILALTMAMVSQVYAWERGNHADDWTPGQTIKVCVDTPPGGNEQARQPYYDAIDEAIEEWNEAQAEFLGLTLERVGAGNECDVEIHWKDNADSWGSVEPGKDPVDVTIESNDGLNERGLTRVLKHEFGHVEGLGHSAKSDLIRADAYSSNPGSAPTAADLNSAGNYTEPTADDRAGKRYLFGAIDMPPLPEGLCSVDYNDGDGLWYYDYILYGPELPVDRIDYVTEFTLDLPVGLNPGDFTVTSLPSEWQWDFNDGYISSGGKPLDEEEAPSPSLLSFTTEDPDYGVYPGNDVSFQIKSILPPINTRAFTNSPSYSSAEYWNMKAPDPSGSPGPPVIPTLSQWGVIVLAVLFGAIIIMMVYRRRQATGALPGGTNH